MTAREFAKTWILNANRTLEDADYDFAEAYAQSECSRLASRVEQIEAETDAIWEKAIHDQYDALGIEREFNGLVLSPGDRFCILRSRLASMASRVEELEKLISKHSGSLNSADSASDTTSSSTAKETR